MFCNMKYIQWTITMIINIQFCILINTLFFSNTGLYLNNLQKQFMAF